MSILVPFNGVNYIIPTPGETGWGSNLDAFFVAIGASSLQKIGGSFLLASEVDFGASFGLKSFYYKSESANIAATGVLRLANATDAVTWRNAANSGDLPLAVNSSNELTFNGVPIAGSGSYTANRAIVSDGSGNLVVSATTATEIGFVSGVTSAIQTQLNAKAPLATPTFTGHVFIPDGTSANPGLAFAADTGNGLWRSAANTWALVSAGGYPNGGASLTMETTGVSLQADNSLVPLGVSGNTNNDMAIEISNGSTGVSAVAVVEATTGFTALLLAAFGPNYTGTRCGQPAANLAVMESGGTAGAGMAIVTETNSPMFLGTNQTLAATISTGQVLSLVHALPIASGGTNSNTALLNGRVMVSAAGQIIELAAISPGFALVSTAGGYPIASSVSTTELNFVQGVTSAIQTQLNGKEPTIGTLTVAHGGTGDSSFTPYVLIAGGTTSTAPLQSLAGTGSSGQVLTSNGASVLPTFQNVAGTGTVNSGTQFQLAYYATSTNAVSGLTLITASRALVSDANGLPVASATTATEIGFVSGVTSAIQTQINAKAPTASPTFTGIVALAAGSVSAPSLTWGDSTTGFYRPALNQVALTVGGVKAWDVEAVGTADGTLYQPFNIFSGGGAAKSAALDVFTQTGITTAKQIAQLNEGPLFCLVYGQDGSNNDFFDMIMTGINTNAPLVVASTVSRGSPSARTYAKSSTLNVTLAMASGTYSTRTVALDIGPR